MMMNAQSLVLLAIVVAAFAVALYKFVRKQRHSGGCGSCNCDCGHCHGKG